MPYSGTEFQKVPFEVKPWSIPNKERRKFLSKEETEIDEAYFGPTRVRGKRGRGASKKIAVIGLLERNGKVFTKPVDRCTKRCSQLFLTKQPEE